MIILPKIFKASETDEIEKYSCPLCIVQKVGDKADTGWVKCPLTDNKFICLGCCIDYQKVASAEDFEEHVSYNLFEKLAVKQKKRPKELKSICLQHQKEISLDNS
jgi:hypothetical protein